MSHYAVDLLRKYAEIVNEAQQPEQLDEGLADTLKPVAQKLGKWLMSKIDPESAKQLKQAYDQAGGDKDKFMAAIGITKDDVAKIAPQPPTDGQQAPAPAQTAPAPQMNEWLSAFDREGDPLKVKILNLLANGIPMAGVIDFAAHGLLNLAAPGWGEVIWWIVSFALVWGAGNYDFRDAVVKQPTPKGKAAIDADLAALTKQYADATKLISQDKSYAGYRNGSDKQQQIRDLRNELIRKYNKNPDGYTSSLQQTDINGNPI